MTQPGSNRLVWRKSSASVTSQCVEVAYADTNIYVRDSKDPAGAVLRFTTAEWEAFVTGVRNGEFDVG